MQPSDVHPRVERWIEASSEESATSERRTGRQVLHFAVSVTFYLGLMGAALWAADLMLRAGVWDGFVIAGPFALAVAAIHVAERFAPYRREWNEEHGDSVTDWYHVLFSGVVASEIYRVGFGVLLLPVAAWIVEWRGSTIWPSDAPVAVRLALAALLAEFGYYWAHRLGHRVRLFWRAHATHHSPERLYGLNFLRDHPFGLLLLYVGLFVPLTVLGCDRHTITLLLLFSVVHGLFQHCNIALRLGPLNWIFSSPPLHRWHHSEVTAEAQHNYGANLIVWDILFRTRFLPERESVRVVGIDGIDDFPKDYLGQMKVPFVLSGLEGAPEAQRPAFADVDEAVAEGG
ncbi:MAG: sterol desaturase family protein [Candidatus Binatia bacterium]|nr:sterol desaturase family protein [Candidatus Binatia bacterium]